jgi:hypothetical protein
MSQNISECREGYGAGEFAWAAGAEGIHHMAGGLTKLSLHPVLVSPQGSSWCLPLRTSLQRWGWWAGLTWPLDAGGLVREPVPSPWLALAGPHMLYSSPQPRTPARRLGLMTASQLPTSSDPEKEPSPGTFSSLPSTCSCPHSPAMLGPCMDSCHRALGTGPSALRMWEAGSWGLGGSSKLQGLPAWPPWATEAQTPHWTGRWKGESDHTRLQPGQALSPIPTHCHEQPCEWRSTDRLRPLSPCPTESKQIPPQPQFPYGEWDWKENESTHWAHGVGEG